MMVTTRVNGPASATYLGQKNIRPGSTGSLRRRNPPGSAFAMSSAVTGIRFTQNCLRESIATRLSLGVGIFAAVVRLGQRDADRSLAPLARAPVQPADVGLKRG